MAASRSNRFRFPLWIFLTIFLTGWPLAWLLLERQLFHLGVRIGILLALLGVLAALAGQQLVRRRDREVIGLLSQALRHLEGPEGDVEEPALLLPIAQPLRGQLQHLLRRLRESYQASLQFAQNAAHELQTPLAIIKGNVELLLQSDRLTEEEIETLGVILQHTNRLGKLNSALILLSKIDNRRFADDGLIDIRRISERVLHLFSDLIRIQEIEVRTSFRQSVQVQMSETLAEILIANLIQNAIRHNAGEKGYIDIHLDHGQWSITNPGEWLEEDPQTLFKRFERRSASEESLGLGLSIVQRICERYGFTVSYDHRDALHKLLIDFGAAGRRTENK